MKHVSTLILLIAVKILLSLMATPQVSNAQIAPFPRGMYTSVESMAARVPDRTDTLEIINQQYGNPFNLTPRSKSVKKGYLKKEVLAYMHDGFLFINSKKVGLTNGFCLALTHGEYVAFHNVDGKYDNAGAVFAATLLLGVIGGMITAAITNNIDNGVPDDGRVLYVLSLRTGNARLLSPTYISDRFRERVPELLEEYETELHPDSERTLIDYLNRLNAAVGG